MSNNELSTLFPGVPFTVAGERLSLRPLVLGELGAAGRCLEAWRLMVATGGTFLNAEAWEDALALLAAAIEKPRTWLDTLSEPDFERVVCHWLAINEEVWSPGSTQEGEEDLAWPEILQRLLEHGHCFEAAQGYTIAQTKAFLGAAGKLEREELCKAIQASAFAMADGKSVSNAVREIRRG